MLIEGELACKTPKGLAALSLTNCGLIPSVFDNRVNGFWIIFEQYLKENGYSIVQET